MQLKLRLLLFLCLLIFCSKAYAQAPAGSLGDPVVQEDFGSGNNPVHPNTNYIYIDGTCPNDGQYSIAKFIASDCHPDTWYTVPHDHTGNDGYMMIVNAAETLSQFFEKQTPHVLCGGTFYEFSVYVKNLVKPAFASTHNKPNLLFVIERTTGGLIDSYETGPIDETPDVNDWVKYSKVFSLPADADAVVLKIINKAPGGIGNDLILDDIAFRAYGPSVQVAFPGDASAGTKNQCVYNAADYTITGTPPPGYDIKWQENINGAGWNDISETSTSFSKHIPVGYPVGTYQYRLGVAISGNIGSTNCRTYSNPVIINVNPPPAEIPVSAPAACEGEPLVLTAFGGATYEWTGPNLPPTIQNPLVIPNAGASNAGLYHVKVTSAADCSVVMDATALVKPKPSVTTSAINNEICEGGSTSLNSMASNVVQYSWLPAAGLSNPASPTPTAKPAQTTTYTLTVTNAGGCIDTSKVTITVNKKPVINLNDKKSIFEGQSAVLNADITGDITGFTWSPATYMDNPNSLTPTVSPTDDIIYTLSTTSATCGPVERSVMVRVYKKIIIPNSFSPNNDGVNDLWNIEALFTYPESTTAVYNRNGQQVFFSRGYSNPWDGTFKGAALPTGTYYYVIDLKNGTAPLKGWLVIIR